MLKYTLVGSIVGNGFNKYSNDMRDKIREILVKYNDNKERNDKAEAELLDLFFVSSSNSTIKTANGILEWLKSDNVYITNSKGERIVDAKIDGGNLLAFMRENNYC